MSTFIVNTSSEKHVLLRNLIIKDKTGVNAQLIYSDQQPVSRLNSQDEFITINYKQGDYRFQELGQVIGNPITEDIVEKSQNIIPKEKNEPVFYLHTIPVKIERVFQNDNSLEDYKYSLLAIANYLKPQNHFRNKITAINPKDHETITMQWVYVSRTVFARLVNALPKENRHDFVLKALAYFNVTELRQEQFTSAIEYLKDYIEANILSQGRLLIAIKELLENNFSEQNIPSKKFIFSTGDNFQADDTFDKQLEVNDNIFEQANRFEKLFAISERMYMVDKMLNTIEENPTIENRFNQLFENKPWPIDLRI